MTTLGHYKLSHDESEKLSLTLIQIGDTIWRAPGVTIGNPFGRLALGATTGKDELDRDLSWRSQTLKEPDFNRLAREGWKREEVGG